MAVNTVSAMSTGDLIIRCDFCYESYYMVNGHDCVVARRHRQLVSYTDNTSGPALDDKTDRIEQRLDELLRMVELWGPMYEDLARVIEQALEAGEIRK